MIDETSANKDRKQKQGSKERYERIGAELRRRRKALSLKQGDVAQQLHLPGIVVNDIETGQVDKLSSLYRRGYIRNYARLLELDPDTLLTDTDDELQPELQEVLPVAKHEWRLERYLKIATYALVTVAIVPPLVYFFVAGGTRMLDRDPAVEEPMVVAQSSDAGQQSNLEANSNAGQTERPSDSSAARHVSASALPMHPVRPGREASAETVETAIDSLGSPGDAVEAESGPALSALQLQLLEDSWIEIHDAEGTRLEYDLLRGGQTLNYEGLAPFRLLVGRSSAVNLRVNGQPVTWQGHESGDVAEIAVAADGEVQL